MLDLYEPLPTDGVCRGEVDCSNCEGCVSAYVFNSYAVCGSCRRYKVDCFSYDCACCEENDNCNCNETTDPCEHYGDCLYCENWQDEYTDECEHCLYRKEGNE